MASPATCAVLASLRMTHKLFTLFLHSVCCERFSPRFFFLFNFVLQMSKAFKDLIWDYIVFIILVIVTSVVPLWGRFFGKKKTRTKADYVFATGAVSVVSMMLSIARGTLGVRSFLGEEKILSVSLLHFLRSTSFTNSNFPASSFNRFSQ